MQGSRALAVVGAGLPNMRSCQFAACTAHDKLWHAGQGLHASTISANQSSSKAPERCPAIKLCYTERPVEARQQHALKYATLVRQNYETSLRNALRPTGPLNCVWLVKGPGQPEVNLHFLNVRRSYCPSLVPSCSLADAGDPRLGT